MTGASEESAVRAAIVVAPRDPSIAAMAARAGLAEARVRRVLRMIGAVYSSALRDGVPVGWTIPA